MNDLVINYNGTPATTQDKVSVLTDNNEQSVQRLIRTYEADLREFGELNFHNVQVKAGLGLTYKKVYCLNEQQATLLLTYMKNTAKVREAKKILVKAFYNMRQKLQECQINGYKGQLAKHNNKIVVLKHELEKASNPRPSDPIYAQIKAERDYYKERYKKLSQSKDETIILNLAKVQKELEKSYTAIGAVMAYANGDDYFVKH
jgi:phage anti-repressor protein, putative